MNRIVTMDEPCPEESPLPQAENRPDAMLKGALWIGDINDNAAQAFASNLLKTSYDDPNRPIMIYIDSYGGAVDALSSMVGVMDSIPNKIVTICMGKAMSAGAVLLSHGDYRYISPHGRVMIHEISSGSSGNVNDLKNEMEETDRMNEHWMEFLAKNCGIKNGYKGLKKFLTSSRREAYMDAKESLKLGIVDQIGVPRLIRPMQWQLVFDGFQRSIVEVVDAVDDSPRKAPKGKSPRGK